MSNRNRTMVVACLTLALFCLPCLGDEYVDPTPPQTGPTAVRGMHACEEAHLATGIHVGSNLLLCNSSFTTPDGARSRIVDHNTAITLGGLSMHACPPGFAVKGVHVGDNLLVCERANIDDARAMADSATQRNGMHACPAGMLMKGLHVGRNVLACVPTR
ncbi:MAG: hypothetical protein ACJ76Y_14545 [Thermoanaerobaculia bacterium]